MLIATAGWPEVGLAAVNSLQAIALAYLVGAEAMRRRNGYGGGSAGQSGAPEGRSQEPRRSGD